VIRRLRTLAAGLAFLLIAGVSVLFGYSLAPGLPWWGWLFGLIFWALLLRRRRLAAAGELAPADPAGPLWSDHRGGGL